MVVAALHFDLGDAQMRHRQQKILLSPRRKMLDPGVFSVVDQLAKIGYGVD
jgi:hypothetical protein